MCERQIDAATNGKDISYVLQYFFLATSSEQQARRGAVRSRTSVPIRATRNGGAFVLIHPPSIG